MPETVNSGTGMPDAQGRHDEIHPAPGTERPRRYPPRLRYELIGCGLHGHELLGTDAAALRA
jgi:hypothetical protein